MKNYFYLLLFATFFSFNSKASHIAGGEITWKCENNGQYRFFMTIYRDCGGFTATFPFTNQRIDIVGTNLPRNTLNQPFSSITMIPDSARWLSENFGEISISCDTQQLSFSCANRDPGSMQAFYYKSDLITMGGVPQPVGWTFYWESPCCRPGNYTNGTRASGSNSMLLRAQMFATKQRSNNDPCIDNSPQFKSKPNALICRGQLSRLDNSAIDSDFDSLIYSWASPLSPLIATPDSFQYATGFSFDHPTPFPSINYINNVPSTLNPILGIHELAIFSGLGVEKFLVVYQVDSWREGKRIASVFREHHISVVNCNSLLNNTNNTQFRVNGNQINYTVITVFVGDTIRLPLQFFNPDTQLVQVIPDGSFFSPDRASSNCLVVLNGGNDTIRNCAYLQQQSPVFDSTLNNYILEGLGNVTTEFVWKTDCSLIINNSSSNGVDESVFNFVFRLINDQCPLFGQNIFTLTVKVKEHPPLTSPSMKGASVGLDGMITYQWVPPFDSTFQFDSYKVQFDMELDGNPPSFSPAVLIDNNLRKYQQSNVVDIPVHVPIGGDPANGPNILTKRPNRDWYFRMSAVSGCKANEESAFSEPLRLIELDVTPFGQNRSEINLAWNKPFSSKQPTNSNVVYESETHFYIWQSDSVGTVNLSNDSNWFVRNQTLLNSFQLPSSICGGISAFRVEARDTVVIYAQGSGKLNPKFDTLFYSTFSMIDTLYTRASLPSLEVVNNNQLITLNHADTFKWLNCKTGQLIPGENRNFFMPTDTGSFAVIISRSGCRDTSDCIPFFPVGLEEFGFQNSLNLYPNPTSGALNIELTAPESFLMKVFNIQGQLLMQRAFVNENKVLLDLEGGAGIYFIQLTNQKGERANLKVLKQ